MPKMRPKQIAQDGATDGQALVWSNANQRWEPGAGGGGGGGSPAPAEGFVQNGLVFMVDPQNYESYSGGTTTVTDIVSGDTATMNLTNAPGLHWDFDGVGDDISFATVPTSAVDIFNGANGGTVQAWVRARGPGEVSGGRILDTANATSAGWVLYLSAGTSTYGDRLHFLAFHSSGSHTRQSTYEVVPTGEWCLITVTYDGAGGNTATIYVNNGIPVLTTSGLGTGSMATDAANELTIGNRGQAGRAFDGEIGPCIMYDRQLTREEISHNYNMLRERYSVPSQEIPAGIPHENLQLHVDYGDQRSFAQVGSVVSDLSPNKRHGVAERNHTITNGHYNLPGAGEAVTRFDITGYEDFFDNAGGSTVLFWIRPETDGEGTNGGRVISTESTVNTSGWGVYTFGDTAGPYDIVFRQNRATTDSVYWVDNIATQNEWIMGAIVYDGTSVTNDASIYINGVLSTAILEVTGVGAVSTDASNTIQIGDVPNSASMFDGDIEIVSLYDKALSAEEIKQWYRETKGRFTDTLTSVPAVYEPGEGIIQRGLALAVDPFDNEGYDGSTTAYDLISNTAATVSLATDPAPYWNFANATDDYVQFATIPSGAADIFMNTGGGTILTWVRIETAGASSDGHILDTTNNTTTGWSLAAASSGGGTVGFRMRFEAYHNGTDMNQLMTYQVLPINTWVQVAVVYDGSAGNVPLIYVNNHIPVQGNPATTTDVMDSDASNPLTIGNRGGLGRGFDGDIGITLMYNRPLSREEIVYTYNVLSKQYEQPERTLPERMPVQNLQLYVDYGDPQCFDQVSSIVRDLSPNQLDGSAGWGFDTTTAANRGHYNLSGDGTTISATWFHRATVLDDLFNGGGTIAAWVRPEGIGETSGNILSTRNDITGGWALQVFPANSIEFRVDRATDSQWTFEDVVYDEWICVMITYDSSGIGTPVTEDATGYLNGQLYPLTEVAGSGAIVAEANEYLTVGASTSSSRMFAGDIEIVAAWDRQLTAHEAQQFYDLTKHRFGVGPRPLRPPQITGNTDNWAPAGFTRHVKAIAVDSSAGFNLTGIDASDAPDGMEFWIINDGSNDIFIAHDVTSTATNRFLTTTGANLTLGGGGMAKVVRDAAADRWRVGLL